MVTETCPHCGAPIIGEKCGYCGAVLYDFSAIDVSNEKATYLKLKLQKGLIVIAKARVERLEIEHATETTPLYADDVVIASTSSNEVTVSLKFSLLEDEDEILYKVIDVNET